MRKMCILTALAVAILGTSQLSRADSIPVFSGPRFDPYYSGYVGGVSDAGAAVGSGGNRVAPGNFWVRDAWRWDASGAAPVRLESVVTSPGGAADHDIIAANSSGAAIATAWQYTSGGVGIAAVAVQWQGSGTAAMNMGYVDVRGINAGGTVVGQAQVGSLQTAALWQPGSNTPLPLTDLNGDGAMAEGINNAGVIVGLAHRVDPLGNYLGYRAVRWASAAAAPVELGHLGTDSTGYTAVAARHVNSAGTAIGDASKYDDAGEFVAVRGVRWDSSSTTAAELAGLSEDSWTYANAINNNGTTVGISRFGGVDRLAVSWASGSTSPQLLEILDGDTMSEARAINASGISVGYSGTDDDSFDPLKRAVYWTPDGSVVDLNTLIDPASGWTLLDAQAISDTGWIAGTARFDSGAQLQATPEYRFFLMQVPEPSGLAMLGLAWITQHRRRFGEAKRGRRTQPVS